MKKESMLRSSRVKDGINKKKKKQTNNFEYVRYLIT